MNRVAFIAASLLAVPVGRAGPVEPEKYVAVSMMFGAAEPVYNGYNVMAAVDGGYRITELLWARAGVGYGTSIDRFGQHVPNGGRNELVRGGVEARWCAGTILCGIAGADLGLQHGTFTDRVYSATVIDGVVESTTDNAFVVIPRIGFDVGGDRIRARIAIEAETALVEHGTTTTNMVTTTQSQTGVIGVELAAGVAFQW